MTTISSLDPSQKQVLKSLVIAGDEDVAVVYGPPGTGKSQLIVNLLFELAVRKKKVLFVSQNIEALGVIESKINELESGMALPDNHTSLNDFCLKLYKSEHRTQKYMRQQKSRLSARVMPTFNRHNLAGDNQGVAYPLSYTHLDKDLNTNLDKDQLLGVDEMLAYYLTFVDTEMIGAPVRSLNQMNIREIFKLLGNFKDEYNRFAAYNRPQDSLRFISKTNPNVNLPEIHTSIDDINVLFSAIHLKDTDNEVLKQLNILDLLTFSMALPELNEVFDLFGLQNDEVAIDELQRDLEETIQLNGQLGPDADIAGTQELQNELFAASNTTFINPEHIDVYEKNLERCSRSAAAINKAAPYSAELRTQDVVHDILTVLQLDISPLTEAYPGLNHYKAKAITELVRALEEWDRKSGLGSLLKKLPVQLEQLMPANAKASKNDAKTIAAHAEALNMLAYILKDADITIETYEALFKKAIARKTAYNPFKDAEKVLLMEVLSKSLSMLKVSAEYGLDGSLSLTDALAQIQAVLQDIQSYKTVVAANPKLAHTMETDELLANINGAIRNRKIRESIMPLHTRWGKYIRGAGSDQFAGRAARAASLMVRFDQPLQAVITSIDLSKNIFIVNTKQNAALLDALRMTMAQDLYSDNFYEVKPGENMTTWHNKIRSIISYQNTAEFDAYVAQQKFIADLKAQLGLNARFVDELLANEDINYRSFVERITNNLVRAWFNSLGPADRQRMPKNYFDTYAQQLKEQRRNYYLAGLENLLKNSYTAVAEISNPNNWAPGVSTMDKIRKNTRMINRTYQIMIATPKEVAKYLAPEAELFDYVVFDEASQLLPGQALPSIYRATKAVIVGDPHQMPPSVTTDFGGIERDYDPEDIDDDGESILDQAIALQSDAQYHLKVHYRSESNKLFEPSRKAIYEEDGIQPIFEAYASQKTPIDIQDDLGDDDKQNFARIIEKINEKLAADPKATFCLLFARSGVLHAFRDYVAANEDTLTNFLDLQEEERLLLSTVTNCQGIEGDHSILYLNYYTYPGAMWFFNEKGGAYKRLNVAITRQKKSLDILMANTKGKWLQVCDGLLNNLDTKPNKLKSAKLLQSLLQNAGEATDEAYLERTLSPNSLTVDSPLTQELFDKLMDHYKPRLGRDLKIYCEVGWNMLIPNTEGVHQNHRNVGFRIDIGIYAPRQNKFVLGIEMDGAMYHSGYAKEHSDFERQQVLETKGWRIYRIWSTNWLNNTQQEFNSLIHEIDNLLAVNTVN